MNLLCLQILQEYNNRVGTLDLVLFGEFLEHLTRVHRILRIYRYTLQENYNENHSYSLPTGSSSVANLISND